MKKLTWILVAVVAVAVVVWRKTIVEWALGWWYGMKDSAKTITTPEGLKVITPDILGTTDNMQSVPGVAKKK